MTNGKTRSRQALVIHLAGDVIPAFRLKDKTGQLPASLAALRQELASGDFALANFEIVLSRVGTAREKLFTMRADPQIAEDVGMIGLHAVTVANNHTSDFGWEALADSISHLRAAGIRVLGAGPDKSSATEPLIHEAGEWRIGIWAFSCLVPIDAAASADRGGIAALNVDREYLVDEPRAAEEPGDPAAVRITTVVAPADLLAAQAIVRKLATEVDVVVVTVHWGFGGGDELAQYMRPLAHALIDAGADVIHGHHMHSVQAVEFYDRAIIFYGTNALISQETLLDSTPEVAALNADMSPDGFLARLVIRGKRNLSATLLPYTLDTSRLPVRPSRNITRIAQRIARLSTEYGTEVTTHRDSVLVSPRKDAS